MRLRVEHGAIVGELRERIGGVLEGVAGEGAERLDFAGGGEPAAHRGAGVAAPVFHANDGMERPQQEGFEQAHHHVVAGVEALHQVVQAGKAARGRGASGVEGLAQADQQGRMETLLLQADENFGEERELVSGALHGAHNGSDGFPGAVEK